MGVKSDLTGAQSSLQEALKELLIINRTLKSKELGSAQTNLSTAIKAIGEAIAAHDEKKKSAKEDLNKLSKSISAVQTAIEKNPDNYVAATNAVKKAVGLADAAEKETGSD